MLYKSILNLSKCKSMENKKLIHFSRSHLEVIVNFNWYKRYFLVTYTRIVGFNNVQLFIGFGHDKHFALERKSDGNGREVDAVTADKHQNVFGLWQFCFMQQSIGGLYKRQTMDKCIKFIKWCLLSDLPQRTSMER